MGWNNPPVRWRELERALSGKPYEQKPDGGDGPGWGRHRDRYTAPPGFTLHADEMAATRKRVPYAELHCHSNFSWLDGASHPEVEQAYEDLQRGLQDTDRGVPAHHAYQKQKEAPKKS